jgi:hypothetical protein
MPVQANWANEIALLGFDLENATIAPGDSFSVTLTYRALAHTSLNYTAFVHLLGPQREDGSPIWAQSDSEPCGGALPTSRWQRGDMIRDTITLTLPLDAVDGDYRLMTGFYTWPDLTRLADQGTGSDAIFLKTIRVEQP